ncbi:MAG: hypothetical protein JSV80_08360 [Acidobacteriota bacterium]|nr:MAG: hypothetical protein JSV80_08360 [Acidobacteriota bacterium]
MTRPRSSMPVDTGYITLSRLAAMALASCALILFEISVTRILSVVLWYHWAFLSVSVAMIGVGAPGVWFALIEPKPHWKQALLTLAGVCLPISVAVVIAAGRLDRVQSVLLCMFSLLLPMLFLGATICLLLLEARGTAVSIMYGADLLGAFLGAMLVIPLMKLLPTPQLAAGTGWLALLAAWVVGFRGQPRWGSFWPFWSAAVLLSFAAIAWGEPFEVRHTKEKDESQRPPVYEAWTPTVRLTVFDQVLERFRTGFMWGRGARNDRREFMEQYWIDQDGSAGTPITRFNGDLQKVDFLLFDVTSVAYSLLQPKEVAIIGSGGGRDILTARLTGAERVDAVELHKEIIDIVSNRFAHISGDVYGLDGVRPVASEGRAYLTRSDTRYDLIQISMIDSWAATAAGAFALSENFLYTLEAYRLYWERLSNEGIVSTSRWARGTKSLELPRLILLIQAALRAEQLEDPNAHLAIVEGGPVGTVLMSKRPFSRQMLHRLREICLDRGFRLRYPASDASEESRAIGRLIEQGPSFLAGGALDLSPPTDDRPFFFQVLHALRHPKPALALDRGVNEHAVLALQILILVTVGVSAVMFLLPLWLTGRLRRHDGFWIGSGYFASIGLGFMLVELPWLHRFILYLGHPSFAATVVLASMLLGAGIGSSISARLGLARFRWLWLIVPAGIGAVNLALPVLFRTTLGLELHWRLVLSVALLAPLALPMGLFFPLGMIRFGAPNRAWFWAVNGAFSVLGSVASLALSMEFGFSAVGWVAVALYLLAGLLFSAHRV